MWAPARGDGLGALAVVDVAGVVLGGAVAVGVGPLPACRGPGEPSGFAPPLRSGPEVGLGPVDVGLAPVTVIGTESEPPPPEVSVTWTDVGYCPALENVSLGAGLAVVVPSPKFHE